MTEDELSQLKNWKSTMEKKFNLSEKERKELEQKMEEMKKSPGRQGEENKGPQGSAPSG